MLNSSRSVHETSISSFELRNSPSIPLAVNGSLGQGRFFGFCVDIKDVYLHIPIFPAHQPYLHFAMGHLPTASLRPCHLVSFLHQSVGPSIRLSALSWDTWTTFSNSTSPIQELSDSPHMHKVFGLDDGLFQV